MSVQKKTLVESYNLASLFTAYAIYEVQRPNGHSFITNHCYLVERLDKLKNQPSWKIVANANGESEFETVAGARLCLLRAIEQRSEKIYEPEE